MGTYTFKWPNAGESVFVTGTFDEWKKTVQLDKVGDNFEKTVTLPETTEKIYYKFVVDGQWTVNQAAPKENDASGIENNVLTPEDIIKSAPAEAAIINSVAPEATTVALAADAPLEKKEDKAPAAETEGEMSKDSKDSPVPGAFPETPAAELEKEVKISPLPASDGAVNPIKLAPGEKIPEEFKTADINANVKLDPESYEKADTLPGVSTTLPPVSSTMIPESSLPVAAANDVTVSSVGPESTTVALAAEVPLEPKAPAIVKESQEKAGVDPEASAVSEEIKEKNEVEAELLSKVPEAPSTSEGTAGKGTEKSENDKTLAETAAATAAGVLSAAVAAKDSAVDQATAAAAQLPDSVKQSLPASVQSAIAPAAQESVRQEVSPEVPAEVKESIKEAGESPEAAANTAAVEEKKKIEAELLKEVAPAPAVGEESKKVEEKAEEKAAETTDKAEEAKPATNGSSEPTTKVVKEPEPTATKAPETPTKKTETPSTAASGDSPATAEKKKKNRFSTIINKVKSKLSSKDSK
ncbi:hypothetical protein MCOR27_002479 [Pyricularia oryzae]|uniref:AMP-activated protein kinase glycogen-binding domain-containing protein n=2 Tax=Pyricularia TaxID=48558 RepID=A0ABQ8N2N1_PYRGI|nr:hypothetical protein MCOR01_007066 [Pyricularia oryzae]KAI6290195.1 hypothetical protein MCOR33_011445 [Pyricularia grisea]KAH9434358.1 hypothetical protein MCOR02_006370 [Pyricularia oryzae]KAI6257007.1 hypothetical protein MCOR19_006586 [Pyricularia oryzae]KAI6277727.1 hypothetical protein MCOR26_005013 [Pyricularia oryzae]